MRNKIKENEKEKTPAKEKKPACGHYWVIEVANGPSSIGTCKYCGDTREFLNSLPAYNPLKKNSNPLALPKLPDVEIEEEEKS